MAVEFSILGQIHLTHPTGADLVDDPVVSDKRTCGQTCTEFRIIIVINGRHDNPPRTESIIDIAVWLTII